MWVHNRFHCSFTKLVLRRDIDLSQTNGNLQSHHLIFCCWTFLKSSWWKRNKKCGLIFQIFIASWIDSVILKMVSGQLEVPYNPLSLSISGNLNNACLYIYAVSCFTAFLMVIATALQKQKHHRSQSRPEKKSRQKKSWNQIVF